MGSLKQAETLILLRKKVGRPIPEGTERAFIQQVLGTSQESIKALFDGLNAELGYVPSQHASEAQRKLGQDLEIELGIPHDDRADWGQLTKSVASARIKKLISQRSASGPAESENPTPMTPAQSEFLTGFQPNPPATRWVSPEAQAKLDASAAYWTGRGDTVEERFQHALAAGEFDSIIGDL